MLTLPTLLLWSALFSGGGTGDGIGHGIGDAEFGWGLLLAAAIAAVAWTAGHWYGSRLAYRRRRWLAEFLADPDRG